MSYTHTQSQLMLALAMAVVAVLFVVLAIVTAEPGAIVGIVVFGLVAVVGFALSSLTTTVTPSTVEVSFRWGKPRRIVARHDVLRVEVVRNRWFYGWGIRWIPGGTLWNVWGLDAVSLGLAGDRSFRIGTDDPQGLAAAIGATGDDAGVDGCWGV